MTSPVAPLITPWNGEVGHDGDGPPIADPSGDGSTALLDDVNASTIAAAAAAETRRILALVIPCTRKLSIASDMPEQDQLRSAVTSDHSPLRGAPISERPGTSG